ncbi:MAG: MtnX-like HAD-IB family phosphatase [Candidatus Bathyarchaeota archaeon]|nr:MtnX-like HAD-IB family phosphatase [Candidatus Bathyarchaeota archaeon]
MSFVVLSDFDGTAVSIDTCEYILGKHATVDWRAIDRRYERGETDLEENLQAQFSNLRASKQKILEEIRQVASFRPGFKRLVEYCNQREIPVTIVSAGIDFVIKELLTQNSLQDTVSIYAPKAYATSKGIRFKFPKLIDRKSADFKEDLVAQRKEEGRIVIYLGNGASDYCAAVKSDFPFAIQGSKLSKLLHKSEFPYRETLDFKEVVETIECADPEKR